MNLRIVILALSLFLINGNTTFGQNQSQTVLFAQCHFSIPVLEDMLILEEDMRSHPNARLVRLDFNTQRAFILTKGLEDLTKDELASWFVEFNETISCVQIGIKGIDQIDKYPFENCDN